MCGLPTETDEDVLAIADLAKRVIANGPRGLRPQRHPLHRLDRRLRAQAAHAVPVGRPARPRDHRRPAAQAARRRARRQAVRPGDRLPLPRRQARHRSRDCSRRGDRRVGAVIEQVWRDGGRFDGWSEHFSYDRWVDRRGGRAGRHRRRPRLVHHPRARLRRGAARGTTSTPASTRTGCGPTGRTPSRSPTDADVEVEDCRWTPCYDCGVCPEMGTETRSGPPAGSCCRSPSSDRPTRGRASRAGPRVPEVLAAHRPGGRSRRQRVVAATHR